MVFGTKIIFSFEKTHVYNKVVYASGSGVFIIVFDHFKGIFEGFYFRRAVVDVFIIFERV